MKNLQVFGMCLNWKVLAGLAMVGLGIWLFAPGLVGGGGLILLLALACPLSCVLMLIPMLRGGQSNQGRACCAPGASDDAQMDQERAPLTVALTPDERLAELRFRLQDLQTQQETIRHHLTTLEAKAPPLSAAPLSATNGEPSLASNQ